ncbi:MAG: hypothetical protein WAM66_06385 [Acidobacteriaceae bacterium]
MSGALHNFSGHNRRMLHPPLNEKHIPTSATDCKAYDDSVLAIMTKYEVQTVG